MAVPTTSPGWGDLQERTFCLADTLMDWGKQMWEDMLEQR